MRSKEEIMKDSNECNFKSLIGVSDYENLRLADIHLQLEVLVDIRDAILFHAQHTAPEAATYQNIRDWFNEFQRREK